MAPGQVPVGLEVTHAHAVPAVLGDGAGEIPAEPGAEVGEVPAELGDGPPPLHAAMPLAISRRTDPNATARVFIVLAPLWQVVDARIPRAACGCEVLTKKTSHEKSPEQDSPHRVINPAR